jgi:flagellin-specific chaperone FliS
MVRTIEQFEALIDLSGQWENIERVVELFEELNNMLEDDAFDEIYKIMHDKWEE